jgi:hypothetical protein
MILRIYDIEKAGRCIPVGKDQFRVLQRYVEWRTSTGAQAHYIWSEIDRQSMFDDLQTEHAATLEQALE